MGERRTSGLGAIRASYAIHRSAWKRISANFAFWGFCELRPNGVLGSTHPTLCVASRSNTGSDPAPVDWGVYHVRGAWTDDIIRFAQTALSEGGEMSIFPTKILDPCLGRRQGRSLDGCALL